MNVLTKEQRAAVARLFRMNPDGSPTYREFRKRVTPMLFGGGAMCIDPWCRLFVGIETDGHIHS